MIEQIQISLPAYSRGFHLITDEIISKIKFLPEKGILHLFIKHTSAALAINENASPDVRNDLNNVFNRLIPENEPYYTHTLEGSDDMPAHVKSILCGSSLSLPITDHQLNLGTWQGIYLCEFRNRGGNRKVLATIWGE